MCAAGVPVFAQAAVISAGSGVLFAFPLVTTALATAEVRLTPISPSSVCGTAKSSAAASEPVSPRQTNATVMKLLQIRIVQSTVCVRERLIVFIDPINAAKGEPAINCPAIMRKPVTATSTPVSRHDPANCIG